MITLLDGPGQGRHLLLRRAPLLLRIVHDDAGNWDACDLLGDEPDGQEAILVYYLASRRGAVHIDFTWFPIADYRLFAELPDDATLRDTERWRAWALAHADTVRQMRATNAAD